MRARSATREETYRKSGGRSTDAKTFGLTGTETGGANAARFILGTQVFHELVCGVFRL